VRYKVVRLDGGEHRGKTFDLKGADHVSLKEEGVFKRCVFKGLRAYVSLALGKYYDCRFEECRLRELYLWESSLRRCKFVDVRIHQLFSDEADIVDCVFSGSIRDGIVRPNSPHPSVASTKRPRQIVGNDFSQCELGSYVFRGGVDLRLQRFADVGDECLVFDGPAFLERAQSSLERPALRAAVFLIQQVASEIKWSKQNHIYVRMSRFDEDVPKRHREAVLAVVRKCAIKTGKKRVAKKARV
jgi:hypothetical protein